MIHLNTNKKKSSQNEGQEEEEEREEIITLKVIAENIVCKSSSIYQLTI